MCYTSRGCNNRSEVTLLEREAKQEDNAGVKYYVYSFKPLTCFVYASRGKSTAAKAGKHQMQYKPINEPLQFDESQLLVMGGETQGSIKTLVKRKGMAL